MLKRQELTPKKLSLKERARLILLFSLAIIVLTGSLIFFANVSGNAIIDIFQKADTVYYNWRDAFAVLFIPVMGYYDVLFFLLLFIPFTFRIAMLWNSLCNIVYMYIYAAFILSFLLALYIQLFPLSDYQSCGLKGPFSGAYYVKDRKMCKQFEYHPENEGADISPIPVTSSDKK
ncbi:DUF1240 domain-containing protein [Salmonella enterica]|nr:DUF1240 domain-containing protein [Salmonella enterica]MBA2999265.1 DUF1240 domain-containing protein [Salmonella enterica subsp. salamae serovar 3,10:b:e,n,x]